MLLRKIRNHLVQRYRCLQDRGTPRLAKLIGYVAIVYALSPIDLIPDVIPVLGYLDDAILLPLLLLAFYLAIPKSIWQEHAQAAQEVVVLPSSRLGAGIVLVLWLLSMVACVWLVF